MINKDDLLLLGGQIVAGIGFMVTMYHSSKPVVRTGVKIYNIGRELIQLLDRTREIHATLMPNGGQSLNDIIRKMDRRGALQEARNKIQANHLAYATFEADSRGEWTYVSRPLIRWTGTTREDFLDSGWLSCLTMDDRESIWEEWRDCMKEQRNFERHCCFRVNDARFIRVLMRAWPVYASDNSDECINWLGTIQREDVTS